jgi:CRISPR system Cascade subunit CasE
MFLSRLTLNLASPAARRDMADAYEAHRTLTRTVADGPEATPGRILWRQERSESGEPPVLLMQSEEEPVMERLPEGYLLDSATRSWEPAVAAGTLLSLRVRANPTVTKNGKRTPLRRLEDQLAWMNRQAVIHLGVEVVQMGITGAGEIRSHARRGGGAPLVATAAQFEGVVRVADPDQLAAGIRTGIGHTRLLGLGLVSIARVQ